MRLTASGPNGKVSAVADALREGQAGYNVGVQQGLARKRAARMDALYEQELADAQERAATKKRQQGAEAQAGSLLGSVGQAPESLAGTPAYSSPNIVPRGTSGPAAGFEAMQGPMQAWGTSAAHAQDFENLKARHAAILKQAGDISGELPPEHQARFRQEILGQLAQESFGLRREHVASTIHDRLAAGAYNVTNPQTGEAAPDEQVQKKIEDLANGLDSPDADPDAIQAAADSIEEKTRAQHVAVVLRKSQAADMLKDIETARASGLPITPEAVAAQHAVDFGGVGAEQAATDWPNLKMGLVPFEAGPGKRYWVSPATRAQMIQDAHAAAAAKLQAGTVKGFMDAAKMQEIEANTAKLKAQAKNGTAKTPTALQNTSTEKNIVEITNAKLGERSEENAAEWDKAAAREREKAGSSKMPSQSEIDSFKAEVAKNKWDRATIRAEMLKRGWDPDAPR